MQKKLIALAVAGLVSAPAFAQSNVTIYGVADAYIGIGKQDNVKFRGIGDGALSGSRLGFRGSEDLGNGLKAVFVLEQGFDIGSGNEIINGKAEGRQALVGLAGGFGSVTFGRQYAPGWYFNYDALAAAAVGPQSILSSQSGMTITPNNPTRWDNSIVYTGSFSGLTARAIYSAQGVELSNKPSEDDAYGAGLDYSNGGLKVGAVYQVVKNTGADKQKDWGLGGSYDFGPLSLHASYQKAKDIAGFSNNDARMWQIGTVVPVGAGNIHLAYGDLKLDRTGRDPKVKSYTLAYTHALSKRTTAYAALNRTDNDKGTNMGLVRNAFASDKNSDLLGVGIRHTF